MFKDRQRSVKKRILSIAKVAKWRTGESYAEVRKITGEIMETAKQVVIDAQKIVTNTKQFLNRNGDHVSQKICNLVQDLKESIKVTEQIIGQTNAVQEGNLHLPNRIISVFDTAARPIRRGKTHNPTEFGYKVMLQETEEQVITGYEVLDGNPSDDTLLVGTVNKHIKTFGRPPRAVAGDRGFGSAENERILKRKGC